MDYQVSFDLPLLNFLAHLNVGDLDVLVLLDLSLHDLLFLLDLSHGYSQHLLDAPYLDSLFLSDPGFFYSEHLLEFLSFDLLLLGYPLQPNFQFHLDFPLCYFLALLNGLCFNDQVLLNTSFGDFLLLLNLGDLDFPNLVDLSLLKLLLFQNARFLTY